MINCISMETYAYSTSIVKPSGESPISASGLTQTELSPSDYQMECIYNDGGLYRGNQVVESTVTGYKYQGMIIYPESIEASFCTNGIYKDCEPIKIAKVKSVNLSRVSYNLDGVSQNTISNGGSAEFINDMINPSNPFYCPRRVYYVSFKW